MKTLMSLSFSQGQEEEIIKTMEETKRKKKKL